MKYRALEIDELRMKEKISTLVSGGSDVKFKEWNISSLSSVWKDEEFLHRLKFKIDRNWYAVTLVLA